MRRENKARERSLRAVEMLGSAIDVKISELTESNRQLKRKIFDLYTIFEISRNFNSVLNYNTLIDSFLLTSLGQVGASNAALYLPDDSDSKVLKLAKSKGFANVNDAQGELNTKSRFVIYLAASAKPIIIKEALTLFSNRSDRQLLDRFPDGLVVPLIIKSSLKGLALIGSKVSGHRFTSDDIEFLSILANQFAIALENARLYESEKLALEELKTTQDQLVRTERLAAIGELSAKIAHEVNNPLSIISNYLHLCEKSLGDVDRAEEHLDVVRQELSRIASIIRQLLDFHKPKRAEKVRFSVGDLIDDVILLVQWQLEDRKILVEKNIAEDIPLIKGSPDQLKQVLLNLVINARDFIDDNGKLKIDVYANDNYIKIVFTDTGPGIPEEILPRVFEPFFTTKKDSSGTGLGLSVCYGIISEHGGSIEADNAPEGGSRFTITLPASR